MISSGTGSRVTYDGADFIVTCAHNIVCKSEIDGEKYITHSDIIVYTDRKGVDTYTSKEEITKFKFHPNYDFNPGCGFDIAICKVGRNFGSNNYTAA